MRETLSIAMLTVLILGTQSGCATWVAVRMPGPASDESVHVGMHRSERAIPYVAADIFSAFLSELIFWPIEEYAKNRIQRVGTAHYDGANRLVSWTISRRNGQTLVHDVASGPPSTAPEAASVDPPDEASPALAGEAAPDRAGPAPAPPDPALDPGAAESPPATRADGSAPALR